MMVIYHTAFDLSHFYGYALNVLSGPWLIFQQITASLFLLLVGISAAISFWRSNVWWKHIYRFARVGAAAMIVSIATYIIDTETFVRFGILHLVAVSALLLPLIAGLKERTIVLGAIILALQPIISSIHHEASWLIPVGFRPSMFRTVDYFPIVPWFGVILIGYGIGYFWYVRKLRALSSEKREALVTRNSFLNTLLWPGRHALLVYVLHQPIILFILWTVFGMPTY